MKCSECEWYKDKVCQRAQSGHLSDIESPICLMRIMVILQRDIWEQLVFQNEGMDEGEDWKYGKEDE